MYLKSEVLLITVTEGSTLFGLKRGGCCNLSSGLCPWMMTYWIGQ